MNNNKKYFGITLDPVHIGAGGYRLGAVDNTIVRDPATDVPKIPGTSLAGVIRAFADIIKKEDEKEDDTKKKFKNINIDTVFGSDKNEVTMFDASGGRIDVPLASKSQVAHRILDRIVEIRQKRAKNGAD